MKAGSTAMTQRPRDRVPCGSMLASPHPRRLDRVNPPTNFWWSLFFLTATETCGMLQSALWPYCINRASVFERHKRFKEGKEYVRDDERCGRVRKSIHQSWLAKALGLVLLLREFRKRFRRKRPALFKSGQWHSQQDTAPVHNSILVTDYLTNSPGLAPYGIWLFPRLIGCCYETTEKMKEAVTKVIGMLIQEDFNGAFQKLLERYNECIAAVGAYFEGV